MSGYSLPESRVSGAHGSTDSTAEGRCYARIAATATALPERRITNHELIANYGHGVAATAMRQLTGVAERRVADRGVADSDLLSIAATRCLAQAQLQARDLSKLIVTKFLGDRLLPMTASHLQHKLGCDEAIQAYDIDGGTHAFVQALDAADCCIRSGDGPILVASGGVINCLISRADPHVAFSYGDGAAAVLLVPAANRHVLSSYSFCNPEYADAVTGFSLQRDLLDHAHDPQQYHHLSDLYRPKDWRAGKAFLLQAVRMTVDHLLEDAGVSRAEVSLFLVTETHYRLWLAILDQLGLTPHDTVSLLPSLGNTMSALLPMALDTAIREQRVQPGSLVMLLSFGEGISGGGLLVRL